MDFVLRNYLIQKFWLLSGILDAFDFPYRISLSLIWYLFTRMLLTFFTGFVFDVVFVYKNAFTFLYRICLMWYLFTRMLLTFLTGFVFDVLFVYKNAFDFLFRICF